MQSKKAYDIPKVYIELFLCKALQEPTAYSCLFPFPFASPHRHEFPLNHVKHIYPPNADEAVQTYIIAI